MSKLSDFIRGEKTEPIRFHVDPERQNSTYRYAAQIYEERTGAKNVHVGRVVADTQLGLRFAVWSKCRSHKKKLTEETKSDPEPWKVRL